MTLAELEQKHAALLSDCFDFSPPRGWLPLVDELLTELARRWPDIRVAQLKEKFGKLRAYIGGGEVEAWDLIHEYERRSESLCETCGAPGSQYGGGWIVTACEAHAPKGAA